MTSQTQAAPMSNRQYDPAGVTVCRHPLIQHGLAELRHQDTASIRFRSRIKEITRYMTYEAAREMQTVEVTVPTPVANAQGLKIAEPNLILAPILRAGLSMIDGASEMFPEAQVRHVGLYRDEATLQPVEYYVKIPAQLPAEALVFILDPMLATGGSAVAAVDVFKKRGVTRIRFLCLIASPEGVAALQAAHPDVHIICASVDDKLNEKGYIVPGLGDAGDRCFGT
jgi:uracil phosphoribosyltransferase